MTARFESRCATVARRLRTVPLVCAAFLLVTALLPLLLIVAIGWDTAKLARGRTTTILRLTAMLWVWLLAEALGIAVLFVVWLASGGGVSRSRLQRWTFETQQAWTGSLLAVARLLLSLDLEIKDGEAAAEGPLLLFVRHASILDNLLPAAAVSRPHGIELRYVLKRELLVDPCLDIAGRRLPNHYVRRDSGDSAEVAAVRGLAEGLGPEDGVLIYPEGTRATPARREKGIQRIALNDPERSERMRALRHCLPPRLGGPLALMEAAPDADVVLMAHAGLDGFKGASSALDGSLIGRRIIVRLARVPRSAIPAGGEAGWIDGVWLEMDAWVDAALAAIDSGTAAPPLALGS